MSMASEDASESSELSKPQLELHFVDHVERKILSPEKEVISPTKVSIKGSTATPLNGINGKIEKESDVSEKVSDTANSKSMKEDPNDSKNSDSGLDSSNNSSEATEEHFVDRQESYTEIDEPEVLTSPNKTVDQLFNFLNSSSCQSLDALNNNSEVIIGENGDEKDTVETAQAVDIYLGKEVALHEVENGEAQNAGTNARDESSMNLYWYSSSLNVDMAELEAFKVSQTENTTPENITSNFEITVGNGYYKTKNIDLESVTDNVYKSETNFDIKAVPVKRDNWSPAFESASSRILDLASELKSEPKYKKNIENESIKGSSEIEKHPWGLDVDSKVRSEMITENQDDLPDIGGITSADTVDGSDNTNQNSASQAVIKSSEAALAVLRNENRQAKILYEEDQADAIGYMEMKDRPIEQVVQTSESSQLEVGKKVHTVDRCEKEIKDVDYSEDVADAIGYMELKDRPIEQVIKFSEQKHLEAQDQGKAEISISEKRHETTSASNIESQMISQDIKIGVSQEAGAGMEAALQGIDVPDAQIEEIEKLENKTVKTELQQPAKKEEKIKEKPFNPYTIKRKYLKAQDSEELLLKMGGMFLDTETLVDEYLDDKNYSLLLSDCWLRLRNKKFEMKVNAAFGYGPNRSPSVEMLTNENEIQEMLMKKYEETLEQKRRVSERQLDVLIDGLGISEFVTFETSRKKYQIDDFIVTLDVTNFGFEVGEIEIVANSLPEMMTDLINLDELAEKLGFRPLQSN